MTTDRYTTEETLHRISAATVAAEQAGHDDIAGKLGEIYAELLDQKNSTIADLLR